MATIEAYVTDQTIWLRKKPKITSGDKKGENKVKFIFDSSWDGYSKTATFYQEETKIYPSDVDRAGYCYIPSAVTAKQGTMYFGVIGTKGSRIRTTENVKYNISDGADRANMDYENIIETDPDIEDEDAVIPHIGENGNWYIGNIDTGKPSRGKDGIDGKDGKDGIDGKDGKDGIDGKDGKNGIDGKDGKDGIDGKNGKDGKDGYGISIEAINKLEEIGGYITFTSGGATKWVELINILRNNSGGSSGGSGDLGPTTPETWRTATQIVNDITVGWNYGNALDSTEPTVRASALNHTSEEGTDYENSWGNPLASQQMMNAVSDKGFNAIRIPVTWNHHLIDDGNGNITISSPFLNRVKAVVDMAITAGMMVFLNSHHDTANYSNGKTMDSAGNTGLTWEMKVPYQLFTTDSSSPTNATMCSYIKKLWTQIANTFKDYDDRLIFEGFNEILDSGRNWNEPTQEQVTNVNNLNNAFIQAVRATGGNNAKRVLCCQTYGGYEKGLAVTGFSVADTEEDKIILQAHLYTDSKKGVLEDKLATLAGVSYPVVIGEMAWGLNTTVNGDTQYYFAQNYVAIARSLGMKCFWWDNNNFEVSAGKYGLLNRSTLAWDRPQTVQGLMDGVTQEALDEVVDTKPYENGTILTDQESSYGQEGDVAVTGQHNCITLATDVTEKSSVTANVSSTDGVKIVRSAFYENGAFISGTRVGYWGNPKSSLTASVPTGATQFKITIAMPTNTSYDVAGSYENGTTTVDFTTYSNSGPSGGSVSDSEQYELVFEDDFSNGIDTAKWNLRDETMYQHRGRKTVNKTQNAEIVNDSDGTHLQLTGKLVGTSDPSVEGAFIDTAYKHVFGYGKIEARIKIPNKNAVGSCFAFWTLGFNAGIVEDIEGENYPLGNTWAETGEIDITEIENSLSVNHKNNYSHSTLHFYDYTTYKDNSVVDMTGASLEMDINDTNWHTYAMEWDELELKIYLDGVLKHTVDIGSTDQLKKKFKSFHEFEQFIILNIGAYGYDSPSIDNPDYTGWPITALVDYVKVWQKNGQTYNTTLDNYTVLPKSITVVSQPNTTEYTRGSAFNPAGLSCKIKYSDDSSHTSIVDSSQLTYAWNSYYAGDINNMQGNAISGSSNYEGYVIVRYEEEGVRLETNVHITLT